MSASDFSPLDLLGLPSLQREIVTRLVRLGSSTAGELSQSLGRDLSEVSEALAALAQRGAIQLLGDGQAQVTFGRTRRRTLPVQLWPALLATDRLYSAQEIATLRTSIPILQFARARMGEFADHGPGHALRVKSFATQLAYVMGLTQTERHLLRMATLFHDVGNAVDRSRHNVISQETVENLAAAGELPFGPKEAALIGLLCRWHRGDYEPDRIDTLRGQAVRIGLAASILRVADAMDIDHRRFDYSEQLMHVLEIFYPQELPFWSSHVPILGVRIRCSPEIAIQVFVQEGEVVEKNIQLTMLREDLESTPLDWTIQTVFVDGEPSAAARRAAGDQSALVVFPFDPHSLVMTALSRKHLLAAGFTVELLCYPDTPGGSAWLWQEVLPGVLDAEFSRLIVIGDRPDPAVLSAKLRIAERCQQAGVTLSLLNRHEANWSALHDLCRGRARSVLGGDWAYFWGDAPDRADLAWGRIAALCTRDPTQSTVGLTAEELAVAQGLLKVVYDAAGQPAEDTAGWAALAKPILERIGADDAAASRAYFASEAGGLADTWAQAISSARVKGPVLIFEESPSQLPQSCYWALEAAIEAQGRRLERGIRFTVPYAIATWPASDHDGVVTGDVVELLAISHWREEEAIPIRLLCPPGLNPPPAGNESTIHLRLPADEAESVVQTLVDACRRSLE